MKTIIELSVILHFDRVIEDTRAVRNNVNETIAKILQNGELVGYEDEGALVNEFNVSIVDVKKTPEL
jgi:hypothetical protein